MKNIKMIILIVTLLIFTFLVPRDLFLTKNKSAFPNNQVKRTSLLSTTTENKKDYKNSTTTEKIIKIPTKQETKSTKIKEVSQAPQTPTEPRVDLESINQFTQKAVVNILCLPSAGSIQGESGSGVIVDKRGVILTNAHVGQYWLLKNYPLKNSIECTIRTGSPAYPKYKAELMYISPTWINENKTILKDTEPKGTGQNDFAFLKITETTGGNGLPDDFPFIAPDLRENINEKESVVLVSYPAGFLGGMTILQNLFMSSAIVNIQKLFTFGENTLDLLSLGGSVVAQKGASGGAVVDKYGTLIGIITTSTVTGNTEDRDMKAITLAHINRTLKTETGGGLVDLLSQNPNEVVKTFQNTISEALTKVLTTELDKK